MINLNIQNIKIKNLTVGLEVPQEIEIELSEEKQDAEKGRDKRLSL